MQAFLLLCLGYRYQWIRSTLVCFMKKKQYSDLFGPDSMDSFASHLMCKTCSNSIGVATKMNSDDYERIRIENRIAHPLGQPFTASLVLSCLVFSRTVFHLENHEFCFNFSKSQIQEW